jgi:hypothetical protein
MKPDGLVMVGTATIVVSLAMLIWLVFFLD